MLAFEKNNGLSGVHDQTLARGNARRKIAQDELILHVAERVIRDEGLDALSMNRLGQETSFAKRTLYLHFNTRHEILASLLVQMLTGWHRRLS